ncbi:MAG: hypothetical protein J3Q66DRAFT_148338 [Benniella sp.]|nr:MAG: hypothetical protein J3Q66DRAFT_148338 [Benniella sp.]
MPSDNLPRNKILVVGRRGVGKLTLVQSILGSRFVPTTSASKSRPSSPLILPAIPVPTLEETIAEEHGIPHGTFTPPHTDSTTPPSTESPSASIQSSSLSTLQRQPILQEDALSSESQNQKRTTLDHSGVTIPWTIDTKYYSVQVDFWIDETDVQGRAELERMVASGELDEMGSVVEAVIFCFSRNQPSTFYDIRPWLAFLERHEPSITLCVATDAPSMHSHETEQEALADEETVDDYDDWCLGNGFEFVDLQERPSDLAQEEHVGLDRIMEALAAHMWDGLKRKSSKRREEHERSMMMSFQDDDVDMTYDLSWRKSILGLDGGNTSRVHEDTHGQAEEEEEEEAEDDSSGDDDEDDDRAFYRALAELNLQNRPASPSALSHGPVPSPLAAGSINTSAGIGNRSRANSSSQDMRNSDRSQTLGFDDDFELNDQDLKALEDDDPEFWTGQESSLTLDRTLEKRFRQFLGQSMDDSITSSSEAGGKESSGEIDDTDLSDKDISFELNENGEFEFGSFVVASSGPGGEELHDLEIGDDELSTPNQESIRSMHKALFGNIDDDDGMAQTISTLQGLREQGKTMSEQDRRELAARVALSFGMHLGD